MWGFNMLEKERQALPFAEKSKRWRRGVNFLLGKHSKILSKLPVNQQRTIYKDLVQACCDHWFGRNVYNVRSARYENGTLSYEMTQGSNYHILGGTPLKLKTTAKKKLNTEGMN